MLHGESARTALSCPVPTPTRVLGSSPVPTTPCCLQQRISLIFLIGLCAAGTGAVTSDLTHSQRGRGPAQSDTSPGYAVRGFYSPFLFLSQNFIWSPESSPPGPHQEPSLCRPFPLVQVGVLSLEAKLFTSYQVHNCHPEGKIQVEMDGRTEALGEVWRPRSSSCQYIGTPPKCVNTGYSLLLLT